MYCVLIIDIFVSYRILVIYQTPNIVHKLVVWHGILRSVADNAAWHAVTFLVANGIVYSVKTIIPEVG
jgi:hypothetical protein